MELEELTEAEKRHIWHPFTQMQDWETEEPLFIESGDGVRVIVVRANDGEARFLSTEYTPLECRMVLMTAPGINYILEASENFRDWTPISTNNATGSTLEVMDPQSGFYPQRFYRARQADF